MASIQNVTLEIVENQGAAAALVTFNLIGSLEDVQQRRTYVETIELIGVDRIPGEDGRDELIPDGRSDAAVTFPLATPKRTRLLALPAARLDEDPASSPFVASSDEDEIRARVTLTSPVSAESNIVVLHEQVIFAVNPPLTPV